METDAAHCPAEALPPPTLTAQLDPLGHWLIDREPVTCELENGHTGPHFAVAETANPADTDLDDTWITWTSPATIELTRLPVCDSAIGEDPEDPTDEQFCLLWNGHPGLHSGGPTWWAG
jgi:hypothetical protein